MAEIMQLHGKREINITDQAADMVCDLYEATGDIEDMFIRHPGKMAAHADVLDGVMARLYFLMSQMHQYNGN